jgi:hypothetical protein
VAREGIEPPTRGFSGRQEQIRWDRGERLDIFQRGLTVFSMVAQHRPEPSRNAEFRYYSGTKSGKRNPANLHGAGLRLPAWPCVARALPVLALGKREGDKNLIGAPFNWFAVERDVDPKDSDVEIEPCA